MTRANSGEIRNVSLQVEGMSCTGCAETVRQILAAVPGVSAVEVSFADKTAAVTGAVDTLVLIEALSQQDFTASPV